MQQRSYEIRQETCLNVQKQNIASSYKPEYKRLNTHRNHLYRITLRKQLKLTECWTGRAHNGFNSVLQKEHDATYYVFPVSGLVSMHLSGFHAFIWFPKSSQHRRDYSQRPWPWTLRHVTIVVCLLPFPWLQATPRVHYVTSILSTVMHSRSGSLSYM